MEFLRACSSWFFDHFSGIVTLLSLIYFLLTFRTWWNTRQLRRRNEMLQRPIRMVLSSPAGEHLVLPYSLLRRELSRGELLGILGMYAGEKRFEPTSLLPLFESSGFNDVLEGKSDELRIPCPAEFFQSLQEKLTARSKAATPAAV